MRQNPYSDSALATGGSRAVASGNQPANLGDILERVLDRGIVIVGDIRVSLLDIELLTIKLRLVVASVDTARQMGIDWWEHDPWLTSQAKESLPPGTSPEAGERLPSGTSREALGTTKDREALGTSKERRATTKEARDSAKEARRG
ncbi:gas vesicle protein [Dactylosporangium salmoneum]|uniref:Gas vesicle structural protein n=1 Tax=Dactylosporangium salmoneum TaxID=53361 RepID=A0ABN3H1Q7_9ACTN